VLTLNRPERLNALNGDLNRALAAALATLEQDAELRAGVITGAGRAFCAGADLKERAAGGGRRAGDSDVARYVATGNTGLMHTGCAKPLLAAVNGHCLGAGLEMALACDIRIAAPEARFGLPEIVRGFFPGGGGPQRIVRAIGASMAMEMLLTGDPVDADTALRCGLVSHVVPACDLLGRAVAIAKRIAEHAPLAVRAVREVAAASLDQPLGQAMRFGSALRWIIGQTDDAKEGPRAFAEKRPPRFTGH
jgi:enoyl-CoA hydratase/carnithine racemase